MTDHEKSSRQPEEKEHQANPSGDPQVTDHPTGEKQAAENAENEPPG